MAKLDATWPSRVQQLQLVAALVLATLLLAFVLAQSIWPRQKPDPEYAFGCFLSNSAGPVKIADTGVIVPGEHGFLTSPFELVRDRGREGGYSWKFNPERHVHYWPFIGPSDVFDIWASDPEALNTLSIRTLEGEKKLFLRTADSNCEDFPGPEADR